MSGNERVKPPCRAEPDVLQWLAHDIWLDLGPLAFHTYISSRLSLLAANMNQRSSRSHTIFRLTLESRKEGGPTVASVLNLVDLAGSESVKKVRRSFTFHEWIGKLELYTRIVPSVSTLRHCVKSFGE